MLADNLVPILVPKIDTPALVEAINSARHQQVSFQDEGPGEYLYVMSQLCGFDLGIFKAQQHAGSLLNHLQYGFLVTLTKTVSFELCRETQLNVTTVPSKVSEVELVVVSGNLGQWRDAIINCCTDRVSLDLCRFVNNVLRYFDKQKLNHVFAGYRRVPEAKNGVFLMEAKR